MGSDVAVFDRYARLYDLLMPGASAIHLSRALDCAERPTERLVDVGGGTGRAAMALPVEQRIVLDAARGMLERGAATGLSTVQGDATRLPLRTASVDAITVVDALHHMSEQHPVFEEAFRALRPGGVLAVSDFDPTTVPGRLMVVGEHLIGFDSTFTSPETLCSRLEAIGFETVVVDGGVGYTVAGVVPKEEDKNQSAHR